jgi:hypothetical protein
MDMSTIYNSIITNTEMTQNFVLFRGVPGSPSVRVNQPGHKAGHSSPRMRPAVTLLSHTVSCHVHINYFTFTLVTEYIAFPSFCHFIYFSSVTIKGTSPEFD